MAQIEHPAVARLTVGPWVFRGHTRSRRLEYIPADLIRALDDVPEAERSPYHGRCAEIAAIARALRSTSRLSGSRVQVAKVRHDGNPKDGERLEPCSTCRHVLARYGVTDR